MQPYVKYAITPVLSWHYAMLWCIGPFIHVLRGSHGLHGYELHANPEATGESGESGVRVVTVVDNDRQVRFIFVILWDLSCKIYYIFYQTARRGGSGLLTAQDGLKF